MLLTSARLQARHRTLGFLPEPEDMSTPEVQWPGGAKCGDRACISTTASGSDWLPTGDSKPGSQQLSHLHACKQPASTSVPHMLRMSHLRIGIQNTGHRLHMQGRRGRSVGDGSCINGRIVDEERWLGPMTQPAQLRDTARRYEHAQAQTRMPRHRRARPGTGGSSAYTHKASCEPPLRPPLPRPPPPPR